MFTISWFWNSFLMVWTLNMLDYYFTYINVLFIVWFACTAVFILVARLWSKLNNQFFYYFSLALLSFFNFSLLICFHFFFHLSCIILHKIRYTLSKSRINAGVKHFWSLLKIGKLLATVFPNLFYEITNLSSLGQKERLTYCR